MNNTVVFSSLEGGEGTNSQYLNGPECSNYAIMELVPQLHSAAKVTEHIITMILVLIAYFYW